MVELRSSHFCLRSCGLFEGLLPGRDRPREPEPASCKKTNTSKPAAMCAGLIFTCAT